MKRLILGVEAAQADLLTQVARAELGEVEIVVVTTTMELLAVLDDRVKVADLVTSTRILGAGSSVGQSRVMRMITSATDEPESRLPTLDELKERARIRDEADSGITEARRLNAVVDSLMGHANLDRVIIFSTRGDPYPEDELALPEGFEIVYLTVGAMTLQWRELFRKLLR